GPHRGGGHARGAPREGRRLRGARGAPAPGRRSGSRMSAATPHEEDALGKAYDARLVKRLFVLARPYRFLMTGSVVVLLLESVLQLAGPLLTAAAIDLVFSKEKAGAAGRIVARLFAWAGAPLEGPSALTSIALLYVATTIGTFVLTALMVEWTSRMGQGVMYDLRTSIFAHLQRAD